MTDLSGTGGAPPPQGVPFREAIAHLRQKLTIPTETWTDLWQGQHARAFVVAGAQKQSLLESFHGAVTRALAEGTTLADFRKDFDRIVAQEGWSYRGSRGWRSRVIFETNMRTARAAGRWAQIQRQAVARPYLRYVATRDAATRDAHRRWHGTVLPVGHEWWNTHYPPNDWGCRCTVQSLSERDMERFGYTVSEPPRSEKKTRTIRRSDGSEIEVQVPDGIGAGWEYHPGIAASGRVAGAAPADPAAWARGAQAAGAIKHIDWTMHAPGGNIPRMPEPLGIQAVAVPLAPRLRGHDADAWRRALHDAIGGRSRVFADPVGDRIAITDALVEHIVGRTKRLDGRERYLPLLPRLIEDPLEIWVGFTTHPETGRVAIRRRYVTRIGLPDAEIVALVMDTSRGHWQALTFFRGDGSGLPRLRTGLRIYRSGVEES